MITIAGTRPNILKIDPLLEHSILWTGQHDDPNMSSDFFKELGLPEPKWNLHKQKLGEMIDGIMEVLSGEKPQLIQIIGDTNSSLAGAIAASQLRLPIAHVEAGLRSGNKLMREENNRIIIDHLSSILFAPTVDAVENLNREGVSGEIHLVGDVMFSRLLKNFPHNIIKKDYVLLTIHRAETTDDRKKMANIMQALEDSNQKFIFPIHPRLKEWKNLMPKNVEVIEPQGYNYMLRMIAESSKVLTDSGGVQREAAWLGVPCLVLRNETEFPELHRSGHLSLVGTNAEEIVSRLKTFEGSKYAATQEYDAWELIREVYNG